MAKRNEFISTAELLEYLEGGFIRSCWCDVFSPGILNEKKRFALSRMISACANAGGGNFFIGGKAKGKRFAGILPVEKKDSLFLEQIINQIVFPAIDGLAIVFFPMENDVKKGMIQVFIPDSFHKPFMASDNRYYIRTGLRENLMEEHQVRTLYRAVASADMELAGIINTNGIPEYADGQLTEIRFYPKFLIRNNGNAPSAVYKFEISIPSDLHDASYSPLQNYFNRLDGVYSVFSFPSRSTVFQSEMFAIAEAKIFVRLESIATYLKNNLLISLYSEQGVQHYTFRLSETFTIDNRPLDESIFFKEKSLKPKI